MPDRRLRVLFMLPSLKGGGAERVACTLLRHLDREKFDLTLAVLDSSDAVYIRDVPDDVTVVDLRCPRLRQAMIRILRLVRAEKPDVVFSSIGHLNLALAMLRPLLPKRTRLVGRETAIVSLLPSPLYEPGPFWWTWAYRRFINRLDTVICQSEDMRRDLIDNIGLSPSKAILIHNPVDVARIQRLAAEPIETGMSRERRNGADSIELVAAGSFLPRKGFDLLIEALALCKDPRLRVTLLGDGPLKADLQRLAVERGVIGQLRFVGFQPNPFAFVAQADAFVLSSRFEGLPNVVLEAFACRTPVIATPAAGGVSEILDGVDGCVLAESATAEALANAIRHFAFGRQLSVDVVSPYAVETIRRRYESVFTRTVEAAVMTN